MPEPLLLGVGLDESKQFGRPSGELEVANCLLVDREDRAGRTELRRHVADRRPVGQGQVGQALAVELDELAHHALAAQHLGHRQHEVGRRGALLQLASELEAEHLGDQHRHRLAEHCRLGLDAADAPAQHAEAVDHRRVRVGADERIRIGHWRPGAVTALDEHHPGQVFEVDLVDDAGVRRNDREVVEGALAPAQEGIALLVALELELGVALEGQPRSEHVHLHRVVDHQFGGNERIDLRLVAPHVAHRVAHRGQVDDRGHAGEVLHHHAGGGEGNLLARVLGRVPAGQRVYVLGPNRLSVLVAKEVLEQDLQRERQPRHVVLGLEGVQAVDLVRALTDGELGFGVEAVRGQCLSPM